MSIILARVIDLDVAKYIVNIANNLWIEDKKIELENSVYSLILHRKSNKHLPKNTDLFDIDLMRWRSIRYDYNYNTGLTNATKLHRLLTKYPKSYINNNTYENIKQWLVFFKYVHEFDNGPIGYQIKNLTSLIEFKLKIIDS